MRLNCLANAIRSENTLSCMLKNHIAEIEIDYLSFKKIDFKDKRFSCIDSNSFKEFKNTHQIRIQKNKELKRLESDAFGLELPRLEYLSLTDNSLLTSSIHFNAFKHLKNLKELDLSVNHLISIGEHLFSDLISLNKLDLSRNCLVALEAEAFAGLVNLIELDLRHNSISSVNRRTFGSMPKLFSLKVNGNRKCSIPNRILLRAGIRWTHVWHLCCLIV